MRIPRICLSITLFLAACTSHAKADSFPSNRYMEKPDSWYRSADGLQVANNVLSHQSARGSWPKNLDTSAKPYRGNRASLRGTFDNGATRGEVRFLARTYTASKRDEYRRAVIKALDDILEAQYPTGGWPQTHPPGSGYPRHITFNDEAMVGLMILLREVAESERFAFVDRSRREKAARAFEKGIECILKCQIVVRGEPTAWCAQHDEVTLEPRGARSYEHASISGGESAGVIRLLMSLPNPSPEVIRAVNAACRWYDRSKLTGIRQVSRGGDKIIVEDSDAPPLWARFYEIGTNRPIFSGRDGVIKYSLAEIEHERRTGYSWYGGGGTDVLQQWPKWKRRHGL